MTKPTSDDMNENLAIGNKSSHRSDQEFKRQPSHPCFQASRRLTDAHPRRPGSKFGDEMNSLQ